MMNGGTLLIFGHGIKGQGQLYPTARGCHALRCLVLFSGLSLSSFKIFTIHLVHCIIICIHITYSTFFNFNLLFYVLMPFSKYVF